MAGEVIAKASKVVDLAFDGATELDRLLDQHEAAVEKFRQPVSRPLQQGERIYSPCGLADAAELLANRLTALKRRALMAVDLVTLDAEEAETLGSISDRSFYDEWQADFEAEYGVGK